MTDSRKHHHCGCPRIPDDHMQRLEQVYIRTSGQPHISDILHALGLDHTDTPTKFERYLDFGIVFQPSGCWLWTRPWPADHARPRVQFQGKPCDVVAVLRLREGIEPPAAEGDQLARTCRTAHCVSPYHFTLNLPTPPPVDPYEGMLAMELWEALHDRPKFQGFGSMRASALSPTCPFGHTLSVYGDPRRRNNYCADCRKAFNNWQHAKRSFELSIANGTVDPHFAYVLNRFRAEYNRADAIARAKALLMDIQSAYLHVPDSAALSIDAVLARFYSLYEPTDMTMAEASAGMFDAYADDTLSSPPNQLPEQVG